MTQDTRGLNFNWCDIADRLNMKVVVEKFLTNVIVFGQNDNLNDNLLSLSMKSW